MKHTMRTLLGVLLALTMAVGLLPGMLSTAHADGYCPSCGSQDFYWSDWDDCFICNNCFADFDEPSANPPAHHHAWGYGSDENTIEARCYSLDDCPDGYNSDGITLTIHAPSSLVCDGNAKTAWISGYPASAPEGLAARPSITYNPGGSTAPSTPGTYTASFSWGGTETASVQFTLTAPAHTHSWSYQANGSTVTATCTGAGDCDYKTNGIALTINAPSNLVCDGNAKAAAISGTIPEGLGLATHSRISYAKNGGIIPSAPTTPGGYTASFTWGGATGSVSFILTEPHTHSWSYQANGATVTASCGQGCDITEGLSITISAPSGTLTYDGNGKAASLSTGYNTTAFPGSYSISYTKNGSPVSGTPTEAGAYTASFTVGTATGSVNYTINKADPIANAPTGLTATYGQTLANVTLSNPQGNTAGIWAWADSTASVGSAGSHTFTANFTPNDTANYNSKSNVNVTVNVNKADPIANAPTGLTATYGQTLANVTLSNPQGNTPGTWAWTDSTASVGSVGSHTFTANFTPNDTANYNTASANVTVTVGKAEATVKANNASKTYGDSDPKFSAEVTGVVAGDTLNYTLSRGLEQNVGAYPIIVNLGENPNYNVIPINGTLTINPRNDSAKDDKSETAGEEDAASVTVEDGVATLAADSIDEALNNREAGAVTVDMSAVGTKITEVVIPNAMLIKVAEAVADETNSTDSLEIRLTDGTIRLNAEAVASIKEQAGDKDLHLVLASVKEEELSETQREAVKDVEALAIYEAYILLDGQRVEISGGSKVTAAVKAELAEGQSESGVCVFAVNEAGEMTEVPVTWEDGEAKFDVDSFSKYVVTYDPAK